MEVLENGHVETEVDECSKRQNEKLGGQYLCERLEPASRRIKVSKEIVQSALAGKAEESIS